MDNANIYVAIVAMVGSVSGAFLSYRASARANNIDASKVDAEAYVRAAALYEKALTTAEAESTRAHAQAERVALRFESETDVSESLRGEVRKLRAQVEELEHLVTALRRSSDQVVGAPPRG